MQISFPQVGGQLHLEGQKKLPPGLRQEGPLLITHWGLSGPLVLKLSAWGARDLFDTAYKGRYTLNQPLGLEKVKLTRACARTPDVLRLFTSKLLLLVEGKPLKVSDSRFDARLHH